MSYSIVLLLFIWNIVHADDCLLDDIQHDCYGYCYIAVKPFLSYIPNMQKRLESCEALKPPYAQDRLESMELLLRQQLELTKSLKQDYSKSCGGCNQNLAESKLEDMANKTKQVQLERPIFRKIGSKYYYIENSEKLTWIGALQKCSTWGAHLVSFENQVEFNNLQANLQLERTYWIDINDIENEGKFISATTGKVAKFLKWFRGEPNNGGRPLRKTSEDCVEIRVKATICGMNDCKCGNILHFVCESETEF